jgi:hypothetical protein
MTEAEFIKEVTEGPCALCLRMDNKDENFSVLKQWNEP